MNKASASMILAPLVAITLAIGTTPAWAANDTPADNGTAAASAPAAEEKHSYSEEAIRHYNRGHDLHQQGFFNQAIAEYKAALVADDRMEEAYTNLGLIYAAQRNYTKAIDAFRKSLALNPHRPNALNGLATVLYAKNHVSEAMEKWKEAVQLDPNFASAFYNMGNAMENEKDMRGAVDAYVHALAVNPAMADAYYRVGSIYAKQKHVAQARLLLAKAVQLEPTAEFAREAKKQLSSLENEVTEKADDQEVKMNVIAPPPTTQAATKSGGS
ncbi:MAG TPA: tetratricopeptide repeat protein [Candidatus Obscuribacterales bacterium]